MYVYPATREHLPDGDKQVSHDIHEHQRLEETLERLEGVQPDDPHFAAIVGQVRSQLQHHAVAGIGRRNALETETRH